MDIIDESSSEQEASIRSVDLRRELQIIKDMLKKSSKRNTKKLEGNQKNTSNTSLYRSIKSKESLNKIFSTFRPGPEIFNLIIAYGKSHKIHLNIPETLIYLPSLSFPVYLHTSKSGIIKLNYTKSSFRSFFSKFPSNSQDSSIPKYIHIAMNERIKLCYDDFEAKSAFEDCPHFSHRLHRFIRPSSLYANKLRVHWKLYKPPTAYIISNLCPVEDHKKMSSHQKLPKLNKSKSDFNQSSFIEPLIEDDSADGVKRFIVQTMGNPDTTITLSNRYLPELHHSLSTITQIISSVFFRNPNKLQELLIDFIKNSDNHWVLISCKGYKAKGDQEYVVMKPQEPEKDDSFILGKSQALMCEPVAEESGKSDSSVSSSDEEEEQEIERAAYYIKTAASGMDRSVGKVVSKLDCKEYSELRQADGMGRVPHLMIGVMPHKTDNPITYFIEKAKDPPIKPTKHKDRAKNLLWIEKVRINPEKYIESTSKHMSHVNKIYNRYRHEAMIGRNSMVKRSLAPDLDDYNEHELSF